MCRILKQKEGIFIYGQNRTIEATEAIRSLCQKENTTAQCVVQHDEGILPWWNDLPDRTIYHFCELKKLSPDDCSSWTSILLILLSILLTGTGIYPLLAKWGGAGALVPITGFANSVAAPAIEYKKEGQVFGIGCKIFTIAGPVILYGIVTSWALGVVYWVWTLM